MRPVRTATALAALMLASAVAAPAVGAFQEKVKTGTTAIYNIADSAALPGVTCRYESHPKNPNPAKDEVDRVVVRTHTGNAPFAFISWVGSRYIIKVNSKPYGDGKFKKIFTSKVRKKTASLTQAAAFPRRKFPTNENNKRRYRVIQELIWYAPGSKKKKIGRVKGPLDVYGRRQGTASRPPVGTAGGPSGWCFQNYHVGP